MAGQLFVISAPSGAGKSTIIKRLRERVSGLGYSVSHTSRPPRHNEKDGIDYHFVGSETFHKMIEEGAFVEWANVYGHLYGTSIQGLRAQTQGGVDVVLDIDHQGAKNIRSFFQDSILIYILPPSLETLEQRLRTRATDNSDVIDSRIKEAVADLKNCEWYDYLIVNDELEKAVTEAESVILSRRCSKQRMLPLVKEMLGI